MTHDEKVAFLLDDLGRRGLNRYTIAPPLYRLLWRLGLKINPPLFASFWSLALLMGVGYGAILGLIMWPLLSWQQNSPASGVFATAALAAVLFGLFMAVYYRWRAERLGLPRWDHSPAA